MAVKCSFTGGKMRILIASAVLAAGLLGPGGADAGWFKGSDSLPRPIDSPIVRPHVKEEHKVTHNLKPRLKQDASPGWGAQWKQIFNLPDSRPLGHYNR
jgi:hypothetical protein